MACLALSLQPTNGPDILLQAREWFPPARALSALSSFRQTRLSFSSGKNPNPISLDADPTSSHGDDPLAASSGQLVIGLESKYRVVYHLVNSIYVLAITTADLSNVFECIETVNQAVSVVVAACDVTPEKLHRKYAGIFMALDIILRGVSSIRLATILSSIHGEGIAKMVHSAIDAENPVRGAEAWPAVEGLSTEHEANVELFSSASFELPPETLAAGDEVAAMLVSAPPDQQDQPQQKQEESAPEAEKDPTSQKNLWVVSRRARTGLRCGLMLQWHWQASRSRHSRQPRRSSRRSLGWRVLKGSMAGLSSAMRRRCCRKLLKGLTMPLAEAWMLRSLWG